MAEPRFSDPGHCSQAEGLPQIGPYSGLSECLGQGRGGREAAQPWRLPNLCWSQPPLATASRH